MLPDEILDIVKASVASRDTQVRLLTTLLSSTHFNPSNIVLHGPEATGKSFTLKALLAAIDVPSAIINCRECITGRQLLEQTLVSCLDAVQKRSGTALDRSGCGRCDSLSALQVNLEKLLKNRERFVLVLDGIDRQRDAPATLLPALARFGELIPNLTIVYIISAPSPRLFHTPGLPHVEFPPYTKEQIVQILGRDPPAIFHDATPEDVDYTEEEALEDNAWLWSRFCTAVWDSLGKTAARDLKSFRTTCENLWRPFVQPIVDGELGTRDFSRLMVSRRQLFQSEDALIIDVVPRDISHSKKAARANIDLPYYPKHILIAAYLASYNPTRLDPLYFMKTSEKKRRRKQAAAAGRKSKHRKIPRNLLSPSPFPLNRLLAIAHALLPEPMPRVADILTAIATLCSLKLLLRTGAGANDPLDPSAKFKVNVSWDLVLQCGRSVGIEVGDFAAWTLD